MSNIVFLAAARRDREEVYVINDVPFFGYDPEDGSKTLWSAGDGFGYTGFDERGVGTKTVKVISRHTPPGYEQRVFHKIGWTDPDGDYSESGVLVATASEFLNEIASSALEGEG